MSRYHVFLAPALEPYTAESACQSLIFHRLSSSTRNSEAAVATSGVSLPGVSLAAVSAVEDSLDKSVVLHKYGADDTQVSRGNAANLGQPKGKGKRLSVASGGSVSKSRSLLPRRSSRLARPGDGLSVLPGFEMTESLVSLNTTATITQPSQNAQPLPAWHIPLSRLITLQNLLSRPAAGFESDKVNVIVCVMAVEPAVERQKKARTARFRQEGESIWIGSWKITAPDDRGEGEASCSVKLWGEMAREWSDTRVRRGDVVLLENVEFRRGDHRSSREASIVISATGQGIRPTVTVLFRTVPRRIAGRSDYLPSRQGKMLPPAGGSRGGVREGLVGEGVLVLEDRALRPDLKLERSDAGIKRVAQYARWFANWVGGEPP